MATEAKKVHSEQPLRVHEWTTPNHLGEPIHHTLGARYDPKLDVAEIAKHIRKLIKEAIKAGYLPKVKTRVRIARFAGGASLDIRVTECPEPIETDAVVECVRTLERFIKSYQNAHNDHNSDLFDTNFYGHVTWYANSQYADWRRANRGWL